MSALPDVHLDLVEQYTLVAGAQGAGDGWIDGSRVAHLAGGGVGGNRAARDAIRHLHELELINVSIVGGRTLYRRTQLGGRAAAELLAADTDGQLARAASLGGLGLWHPQPGDPADLDELVGQDAAKYRIEHNVATARATGRTPQAMLFTGPPGVGKTLTANIIGRRLGVPVLAVSLADLDPNPACRGARDGDRPGCGPVPRRAARRQPQPP